MSEELKPCPFCGGKAHFGENHDYHTICCNDCWYNIGASENKNTVIKHWNTRPIEDGLTEEIDRLRKTYANKAELVEALISVVDTARTAVEQQWCWRDQYPGQKVKYDRDIAPILTAEKLILKHKESK